MFSKIRISLKKIFKKEKNKEIEVALKDIKLLKKKINSEIKELERKKS